jgi:hypothetical protein
MSAGAPSRHVVNEAQEGKAHYLKVDWGTWKDEVRC